MQVAPAHSGVELGIGDAILIKSLAQATGRQEAQVKKEYASVGDLGEVACNSKGKQRTMFPTKPLTIKVAILFSRLESSPPSGDFRTLQWVFQSDCRQTTELAAGCFPAVENDSNAGGPQKPRCKEKPHNEAIGCS